MRLAVWRCFLGAPRSPERTESTRASWPSSDGRALGAGSGGAGGMSAMSAYLDTVLRLTPSPRAASALGTPLAPVSRMSCCVRRGTVIFPSSSRASSRQRSRPRRILVHGGPRPCPRGHGPLPRIPLSSRCAVCSFFGANSAQFLLNTNSLRCQARRARPCGPRGGGTPGTTPRPRPAGRPPRASRARRSGGRATPRPAPHLTVSAPLEAVGPQAPPAGGREAGPRPSVLGPWGLSRRRRRPARARGSRSRRCALPRGAGQPRRP